MGATVEISLNCQEFTSTMPPQLFEFHKGYHLTDLAPVQGPVRGGTAVSITHTAGALLAWPL